MPQDRIGHFRADRAFELLARGAPDSRHTAEALEQQAPAPGTEARNAVELGSDRPLAARGAMERDREAMRLVADALEQQKRGRVGRERHRVALAAQEDQLLFL